MITDEKLKLALDALNKSFLVAPTNELRAEIREARIGLESLGVPTPEQPAPDDTSGQAFRDWWEREGSEQSYDTTSRDAELGWQAALKWQNGEQK